jgi:hypothetical protein
MITILSDQYGRYLEGSGITAPEINYILGCTKPHFLLPMVVDNSANLWKKTENLLDRKREVMSEAVSELTITEALAEIKTIEKRIDKKREFIRSYLSRPEGVKDPLAKQGGSEENIRREMQAVLDLENRTVNLRRGIQRANERTEVTIEGTTRSIADWLVWRRDAAPHHQQFLNHLRASLNQVRENAKRSGASLVSATAVTGDTKPNDIVVNIDEQKLANDIEQFEIIMGKLDGILCLKNATVTIDIEE